MCASLIVELCVAAYGAVLYDVANLLAATEFIVKERLDLYLQKNEVKT